ncbi:MAG: hypothetical protein K6G45_06275 [Lachnospiraceae bacterium]|nr:hypothetical protein [Lachnospiraceae bacterium]
MASMKITVDELRFKKTIYSKAAKNLRDVIAVVKKAKNSIGNDKMFAEARQSLGKLTENMDRRATVLEALAEALVYSADTYKGAQTKAVSSISDYKAHKTDFYGNPVHVSGAAGAGAGAAAGAAAASQASSAAPSSYSGSSGGTASSAGTSAGTSTYNASQGSSSASGSAPASDSTPAAGDSQSTSTTENYTENITENITNNTVIYNTTINNAPAPEMAESASIAAETVAAETVPIADAATPAAAATTESAGIGGAAMFGAGAAAAAAAGAAAMGVSKVVKKKKEENSIDHQIEVARKKIEAIQKEQDEITASLSEEEEET